jgi:UDP-N-acetylmuramoyl-L-alanyl-D-glutamate--2,6-diaminopimelate ligase
VKLGDVLKDIPEVRMTGSGDVDVAAIRYDSRRVAPGDLFAAIVGETYDGAKFIGDADQKGATSFLVTEGARVKAEGIIAFVPDVRKALALASRNFYADPSARIKVAGITGTNGKTTTSYIIHGIMESARIKSGLIGTVQYLVGGEIVKASRTTPESPDLNALLDNMVRAGCEACIMEVSSHALTLNRVDGVNMEVAVFTNLTRDHLDFHPDMEDYYRAKAALFLEKEVKHCSVNMDDPYGVRLKEEIDGESLTFGMKGADICPAGPVDGGSWGSRFDLMTPWGVVEVKTVLPGSFNVSNIMAAVSACGLLGLSAEEISAGIQEVGGVPGRFESVDRGQGFSAIVDYAHTPDALENLAVNVREITTGRVILVFGCGGDRDRAKRPMMAEVAASLADEVVVTSDNPRSEDPEKILDDIMSGIDNARAVIHRIADRREAIALAVSLAEDGDSVVVAGKGHENYQVVGERTLPFFDVDELATAIEKRLEDEL